MPDTWIKYEVEHKVRRLAAKKCKRKGFGWKRWSSAVVYGTWGFFRDYRVVYWSAKACPG
jgi:RNA-directed DNA polymerase